MPGATETLQTQIEAIKQGAAAHLPASVGEVFTSEQAKLREAGLPAGVPAPGSAFPDGELLTAHGTATTLKAAQGGRAAVVVLYRGAWCPFCNVALRAYQTGLLDELTRRDVALIAISPQTPDGSLTTQETNELSFTVLSDPGNQIARGLGVLHDPAAETIAAQAELGVVVADGNADHTAGIPMPTTAVLDATGILRWIDVHPDYTTRTEPAAILEAVDAVL